MKKLSSLTVLFAACALVAAIFLAPATDAGQGNTKPAPQEETVVPFFFDQSGGQSLAEDNCTWTCSDGRTGSAEVITEGQCEAACEGACGENCEPAAN